MKKSIQPVEGNTENAVRSSKSSFGTSKPRSEPLENIILKGAQVQEIKNLELHDLKNLFTDFKNITSDGKKEAFDRIVESDDIFDRLAGFDASYNRMSDILDRMEAISNESVGAFSRIAMGELSEKEMELRLQSHAAKGEEILAGLGAGVSRLLASGRLDAAAQTKAQEILADLQDYQGELALSIMAIPDKMDTGLVGLVSMTLKDLQRLAETQDAMADFEVQITEFEYIDLDVKRLCRIEMGRKESSQAPAEFITQSANELVALADELNQMARELQAELAGPAENADLYPEVEAIRSVLSTMRSGLLNKTDEINHSAGMVESFSGLDEYTLRFEDVDVRELAADVMRKAGARKGDMEVRLEGEDLKDLRKRTRAYTLSVDPLLLKHIISNIATNGAKYAKREITLGMEANADKVFIILKDDGDGMKMEEAARAFERGVKNENATESSTGFGLSASAEMARLLGARVYIADPGPRADPDPEMSNRTTTFVIELPRRKAA